MVYQIYSNGKLLYSTSTIDDVLYVISNYNLSIINEDEDLENHVVIIDCEEV